MGVGPIPRSKIRAYATDELDLYGDAHERFCELIIAVDTDYVSMANETKKTTPGTRQEVSTEDGDGVKSLIHKIADGQQTPRKARRTRK